MPGILAFEGFELDENRFELRHHGARVEVQPKVLRLLFHLVAHRDRSVSKQELLEQLWPGEVVTAASIKRAIAGARRALGQRGDSETSIRTVRGHGYQFMLPARELPQATPPPEAPPAEPLFVGREEVLARLDALLGEALSGRARSALIVGEPGVGKTRMLQELGRRAPARGAVVLTGRCMEVEGAPALWPVQQLLRCAAELLGPAELRVHMGDGAADIAEALPELRRWLPDLPDAPRIDSAGARLRFFESMARFLRRAAEQRPIAVLLDDLQCADAASLRLLEFLIAQLDAARVLLVGSVRKAAREAEALRVLFRKVSSPPIELTGFRSNELARYLAARTGAEPPEAVVERLHELTGGNALFVEQLVHCLTARAADAAGWSDLLSALPAADLEGAIERHLDALEEPAQRLLRGAAVLGREFSLRVLGELVEQDPPEVLAGIERALALGVVRLVPHAVGQYRFAHALIREALYAQLPAAERARLHGRAGRLLEAQDACTHPAQLSAIAEHFALAAPAHDGGLALRYAVRAARAAAACLSPEQAAAHYGRALQLLDLSAPDARVRMELLLEQGEALTGADDGAARTALLEAGRIAAELGAADAVVRAARAIGQVRETGSVDPAVVELIRRALALVDECDPRWPVLQALFAKALSYSRHEGRARDALKALAAARQLRDPAARGEALAGCLYALPEPEWLPQRIEIERELEAVGHEKGDHRLLRAAATAQVWSAVERGDMRAADAAIGTLDAIARQVRDPFARWEAELFRTMRALIHGPLELAERRAEVARELGMKLSPASAHHLYVLQRNAVLRLDGRLAEAEALVRDISMLHPALPGWQLQLAAHEAHLGRTQRARAVLDRMLDDDLALLRREPFLLGGLAQAADLCMLVGDAASARLLYDALLPYEDRHGNVSFGVATHGPIARHLGRLASKIGDELAAERHLRRAIAIAEAMPSVTYTSVGCLSYASMLIATGRPEARARASALIQRSYALARSAGLRGITDLCRDLAARANVAVSDATQLST